MTNNTGCLASHVETVLDGPPKRTKALRTVLSDLEKAKTTKAAETTFIQYVTECIGEPISDKNKRRRIELAAAATGSVLAGLGAMKKEWTRLATEACEHLDNEQFPDIEDAIAGHLYDGAEHPWTPPQISDSHAAREKFPKHAGSFHYNVLRALDKAKRGDVDALYSPSVIDHMAYLSPEDFGDKEIAQIKAKMKAAKLDVPKWDNAIAERRRAMLIDPGIIYADRINGTRPNPKSRRNVQQFINTIHARVWFDEFTKKAFLELEDNITTLDDDSLREWMFLMRETGLPIDKETTADALQSLARQSRRHPVREYLAGIRWDGTPRVDTWLSRYAGAKDTDLNQVYGRKFLIGAVRRIMSPGTKLRAMPILEGEQNIGKSLVFKTLAVRPEWYTDSLELGCDPKEVIELTEGKWIVETPELSGMTNRDVEHVKAMVSRDVDKARLAYCRFPTEVPRQFVLGGTTNSEEYLKDRTGNTRFWGIKVAKPDIAALERDRDQLWAEAVQIEATGEAHWLDRPETQELARRSAQRREEQTPLEQKWIIAFEQAKSQGNIFILSDDLYRLAGLEDAAKPHQGHKNSLRYAAKQTGWMSTRKRTGKDHRPWGYVPVGVKAEKATLAVLDRMTKRFKAAAKSRTGVAGL